MMNLFRIALVALALVSPASAQADRCEPRDFGAMPLPAAEAGSAWKTAILMAYPGMRLEGQTFVAPDGQVISAKGATGRPPPVMLRDATLGDQFAMRYPLTRDLTARQTPFHDPGRFRNGAFFAGLYGTSAEAVRAELETVEAGPGGVARFNVTRRHGVACQLRGAIEEIERDWPGVAPFFRTIGGSFNWRQIAGTSRLSAHSYGIAIDVNAELGGYWRWSGAKAGAVGKYDNKLPWPLVEALERHGFIWGGKWHHFDGMHFEYRPELILFSRLTGGS